MHDAPMIEPLEANAFFADNQGARPIPAGTVARGWLREDTRLYEGRDENGTFVTTFPLEVTRETLLRGQQRYEIFCSPCHDSIGTGNGMIVRRGFKVPPSYHEERLRGMPVGYFYDVISHGFGVMASYGAQVPVADRWAIVAYIRALQASRGPLAGLPSAVREAFRTAQSEEAAGDHRTGHHP